MMLCRVVCGFGVTMLIFSSSSVLISVDLPVFGRPATATNPERYSSVTIRQLCQRQGSCGLLGPPSAAAFTGGLQIQRFDLT